MVEKTQKDILWNSRSFPLDYMMTFKNDTKKITKEAVNSHLSVTKLNKDRIVHAKTAFKLKNILKNLVFKIVLGVRAEKMKPKIGDIIKVFHKQSDQGPKGKELMIKKIKKMYPKDEPESGSDEDPKFEKMFTLVDRIVKAVNRHQPALIKMEIKVDNLAVRKNERMKNEAVFRR